MPTISEESILRDGVYLLRVIVPSGNYYERFILRNDVYLCVIAVLVEYISVWDIYVYSSELLEQWELARLSELLKDGSVLITFLSVPEIIKAKSYADRFTERLYTVKTDVPIVRMGYVLERIIQRFEETAFTSKEGIHDVAHYVLKNKLEKAEIDKLVVNLLEERKPLVEARADIDFLLQGVTHELNMIQISRSPGGYKLVDRVEGGVQVDQDILKRAKMCEQEMKAEEKKTNTKPKGNRGGGRGGRGGRDRGRGYGPGGVRVCFKCEQPGHYSHSCPKNAAS